MQVNKLTGTINILNIKTYIYDYNIYSQVELPINTDINVKYKITDRRPGDIDACYADPSKARDILGWEARLGIEDMCRDAYNFVKNVKED